MKNNKIQFRKTAQAHHWLPGEDPRESLGVSVSEFDQLVAAGVPYHLAKDGRQEERPDPKTVARKLAAGATLFLVQPHEYMPRLRRFIHQAGVAAGFSGRPARSFLFRVDRPGEKAMPLHDDGSSELLWLQLRGERFVTFGSGVRKGSHPEHCLPADRANGKTKGWFQGGLKAGSLLYLPPFAPHHVLCRKPSVAISIYWEAVTVAEKAAAWLRHFAATEGLTDKKSSSTVMANLLADASQEVGSSTYHEWEGLEQTRDDAQDRPPLFQGNWSDPNLKISAWKAMLVRRTDAETVLLAGGETVLTFPREAYAALRLLSNYGAAERGVFDRVRGKLTAGRLTQLLGILNAEGLIGVGELPKLGPYRVEDLTGGQFTAEE